MQSVKIKGCEKRIVKKSIQSGFCILGDWIIEFNEDKFDQTNQDYRTNILREYHKSLQVMEVHVQRKKPIDKNLNIILDILSNSNNPNHSAFYQVLLRYQVITSQYSNIFKIIKHLLNNPISQAIISQDLSDLRSNFNQQIKIILEKQLSSIDFFFYTITSNNYEQEMQEKTKFGYSTKMMLLLARSVENFEHVYLKERSFEIFDQQSQWDIFSCQILEQSQTKCKLRTLDNITLEMDVKICILCDETNDAFAQKYNLLKGFFKDSVICIYYPQIQQHHLDLLYKLRKDIKNVNNNSNKSNNWDTCSSSSFNNNNNNDEDSFSQNEIISKFYTPDNQYTKQEDDEESLEKMKANILQKQRRKFNNNSNKDNTNNNNNDNQICDKLSSFNLD